MFNMSVSKRPICAVGPLSCGDDSWVGAGRKHKKQIYDWNEEDLDMHEYPPHISTLYLLNLWLKEVVSQDIKENEWHIHQKEG